MMTEIRKHETIAEATTGGDVFASDHFITMILIFQCFRRKWEGVLWPSDPKLSIYLHGDAPLWSCFLSGTSRLSSLHQTIIANRYLKQICRLNYKGLLSNALVLGACFHSKCQDNETGIGQTTQICLQKACFATLFKAASVCHP